MFTQFKSLGVVSMMTIASVLGASAATITVDNITYTTKGEVATVAALDKTLGTYKGDLVIPAQVTADGVTYTVGAMAASAFKNNKEITSITFAAECDFASLPRGAFQGMEALTSVVLPGKVGKTTQETFKGDSLLQELVIPGNMAALNTMDFQGCVSLKKLTFAAGETSIQVNNNIWGDTKPAQLTLEELVINRELTSTAVGSADLPWQGRTSLKKVTYADNITSIPAYYFQNCTSLTDINVPAACKEIGAQAFLNTGLTELTIPAGVTAIPSSCFAGSKALTKVVLLGDVTSIGDLAFNQTALSDITWPATLTSIGAQAFNGANLTGDIVLPAGVTRIGDMAFADNANITSIQLPAALTNLGSAPFKGDTSLSVISIDAANESYKIDAAGALVVADNSLIIAYPAAATAAEYTSEATAVGPYAFFGASNLRKVTLPSCTNFGDYCLSESGIESMKLTGTVGRYALANCPNLAWAHLNLHEIPVGVCAGCTSLKSYINYGITTIVRQDAFKGCTSLKELDLSNVCVIIEADAFADVDGLNLIIGTNNPPSLAAGVFVPGCKISATVPTSCVAAYKAAEQWCNLTINGDDNVEIGGLDLGMPSGMYYAGEDGVLHCRYADGGETSYDVGGVPHTFQLAQFNNRIYGASAGKKFIYSNTGSTDGDGKLFYISRVDQNLFQATVLDNTGNNAYKDPFALYVYGEDLFVNDRNVCLRKIPANAIALPQDYPSFMENNWMNAYNTDFVYGCIKAGFSITKDKDDNGNPEPLFWIGFKYNGNGIFRFKERHIGSAAAPGPETGYKHIFKGATPHFTTFYIDEKNGHMYLYLCGETANLSKEGALKGGIYRFNLADIENNPDPAMMADLNPVLIDGAPVYWEGGQNEQVGISQFSPDENGEYLYWCYRAPSESDVEKAGDNTTGHYDWAETYDSSNPLHQSGIKRIKLGEAAPAVEMLIPGAVGYGIVPVNYAGSTTPAESKVIAVSEKVATGNIMVAEGAYMVTEDAQVSVIAANGAVVSANKVAANAYQALDGKGVYMIQATFANGAKKVAKVVVK